MQRSMPTVPWNLLNLKCKMLKHVVCNKVHYKMEWWNEMPFTVWYRMIQVVSIMKLICHAMSNAWPLVTVPRYLQLTASSQLICSIDPGTHAYLLQFFLGGRDFKLTGWIFLYSHHHASLVSPKNIQFAPPSLSHCEGSAAFPAAPHLLSDFLGGAALIRTVPFLKWVVSWHFFVNF